MSMLTYRLLVGAAIWLALLATNSIAYRIWFGTFPRSANPPGRRRVLSKTELALCSLMVLGFVVGVAAPVVAPGSAFGRWLLEPYAQLAFGAWCLIAAVSANIVIGLMRLLSRRRGSAR
jgi:hypothetical protein